MPLQLRSVQVHLPQIATRIPLGLVGKVLRLRIATLSTGSHSARANAITELHDREKAVSARAIDFLAAVVAPSAKRSE